jgi:UDP-N-acetylmuramate: L-alanyl-gamma-D-glutamyl-meso-diaminopimelate ligase
VKPSKGAHIHLIGICGTAMAGLAGLLKARGFRVTGSDEGVYPPMSLYLEELGVRAESGFDQRHLDPPPDLTVIGNAIRRGNPEAEAVLDGRLPFTSLPVLLKEEFLLGKRVAVVAGTHGKTTTSSMLAHVLSSVGADPSFLIGGLPIGFGTPARLGKGDSFVLEGDEYDTAFFDKGPKLMHYIPDVAVLNAVEMDHADIYKDFDTVKLQFRRWVNIIPRRSLLLVHGDDPMAREVVDHAFCRVETFGEGEGNTWRMRGLEEGEGGTTFDLARTSTPPASVRIRIPTAGAFNARNAVAAIVSAAELGVSLARAAEAMSSFPGVRRRLEVRGEARGVLVVDDFAHHPTAIRETLRAARSRWPGRRLVAVLEPRSWSLRRRLFQNELPAALAGADLAVVASVYHGEALSDADRLDVPRVAREIAALGVAARNLEGAKEIVASLVPDLRAGDVVLVMSNGGFDGIHERLLSALGA